MSTLNKIHSNIPPIEDVFTGWDTLTPDERVFVKKNSTVQYYKKGEIIYSEGDTPTHMMVLARGKAKVYKGTAGRRMQIVRMLAVGVPFAYRAMIANETYNTTVAAFEASAVYMLKADIFRSILRNNNGFCFRFLEELATDLADSDSLTINLTQKHIRGRLAETLLFLKKKYGLEEDGATINIYLSRDDLANFSNMTTSNAIRALMAFENEHIIAIDGRRLKIINEEKLIRISKLG